MTTRKLDEVLSLAAIAGELKDMRDLRSGLIDLLRNNDKTGPSSPGDWKALDLAMAEMISALSEFYGRQMMLFTKHADHDKFSVAEVKELLHCNKTCVVLFSIIVAHLNTVIERGRPETEAHLHYDRMTKELEEGDAESVRAIIKSAAGELFKGRLQ